MNAPIFNRNNTTPPDDGWYHIEVTGEHPAGVYGTQVIDSQAIGEIVKNFREMASEPGFSGMLIDLDHLSHDIRNTTEAYGWLWAVEARAGQLWGRIEWTDLGEPAIRNKRVKFFSTEYDADSLIIVGPGRVRPTKLSGLALTNRPNNKGGKAIANRVTGTLPTDKDSPVADGKPNDKTMNTKIAEMLGLPPNATEEQILTALTTVQADLKKYKEAAESAKAEADAEMILNREAGKIPSGTRDSWKSALILNREATEKVLVSMPLVATLENTTMEDPKRIFNRADSKTPEPKLGGDGDDKKYRDQAEAVASIRNRDKSTFQAAWEVARREKPELFN